MGLWYFLNQTRDVFTEQLSTVRHNDICFKAALIEPECESSVDKNNSQIKVEELKRMAVDRHSGLLIWIENKVNIV